MAVVDSTLLLLLLLLLAPLLLAEKSKCKVCRDLTTAATEHFEKTVGHNFGGGNTAWEERSLGTYATSETRLVEILEKTAKKCDYKCGSLLEDQEEFIEEWFFKRQETDLFSEMCVEHLKRCCPKNTWGPDCAECPGGVEEPCSGKGKCKDQGDRESDGKLSGTCSCDKGYNGTLCDTCKKKFIRVEENCEACSSLCKGQCVGAGPQGCEKCIKGYELLDLTGCTDINECELEGCGDPLEDCMNSPGSYECVCKTGYTRVSGKCQLEDLYATEDEDDGVEPTQEVEEEAKEETEAMPESAEKEKREEKEDSDDDDEDSISFEDLDAIKEKEEKDKKFQENLKKLEDALGDVQTTLETKEEL